MIATNSNYPNNRSPFQAIPPTEAQPASPPLVPPATLQPTSPQVDEGKGSPSVTRESSASGRWLVVGAMVIGVGCLGFLPIPQSVSGEAEITSTLTARQTVTIPISGRVKEMLVRSNQTVEANQPLAILVSEDLDKDISKASVDFQQARSAVALAQQQQGPVQAQFNEAIAKVAAARQKASFLQQQLENLKQGNPPPQIQELLSEQAAIKSEIIGFVGELDLVKQRLNRYEKLMQAGALSFNDVEDLKREQQKLLREIADKTHQVQAKAAQIDTVKQNLQQELQQQLAEVKQTVAASMSAMQLIKKAAADVQIQQVVATKMGTELERTQNLQKELLLRATTAGTVVTPNLDLVQNQYLQAGSKVIEIVDLHQLTTSVQIRPSEAPSVKPGANVTFRPQGTGLLSYTGTVQAVDIDPVVSSDAVQHPPSVTVRVALSGGDNLLRPGLKGYAHIESPSMRLYQKLQQEFVKLVPVGKFF